MFSPNRLAGIESDEMPIGCYCCDCNDVLECSGCRNSGRPGNEASQCGRFRAGNRKPPNNRESLNDAVVIDDVGPSRWTGTAAGQQWLSNVTGRWGKFRDMRFTTSKVTPAEVQFNGNTAYLVVEGTVTSKLREKPIHNYGAFTFTLSDVSGSWKITSQTWTSISR